MTTSIASNSSSSLNASTHRWRYHMLAGLTALVLMGCSNPESIVLGPKPMETLAENKELIGKLPEQDRDVLVRYLMAKEILNGLPGLASSEPSLSGVVVGKKVGEVLLMAREWESSVKKKQAEEDARKAEAEALKQKALAERKAIADRISQSVNVALLKKTVLSADFHAGRFDSELRLLFAVQNKSAQGIKLLKGKMLFADAAGDPLGFVNVEFDQVIPAGATVESTTGGYWKLNAFNHKLQAVAAASDDGLKSTFEPTAVVFADGTLLKAEPAQ